VRGRSIDVAPQPRETTGSKWTRLHDVDDDLKLTNVGRHGSRRASALATAETLNHRATDRTTLSTVTNDITGGETCPSFNALLQCSSGSDTNAVS